MTDIALPRPIAIAPRRAGLRKRALAVVACVAILVATILAVPRLGLLDPATLRMFDAGRPDAPVAVVYFSGDMGMHFGMGPKVAPALAAHGLPVVGVSSAKLFHIRRTRAEVDAIVADAIRAALDRTGAKRVVLMGQSYGADIVATASPDLPADLRARIVAIAMVVPAQTVYFRADPLGFAYHGTPDATPAAALRQLRWAPLICIRGEKETGSLCPDLADVGAHVVTLPGGHFLRNDHRLLAATLIAQLHAVGVDGR